MDLLIAGTAFSCALVGGVFFAFSSFVMRGLRSLPPAHGIAAMQAINVLAVTPVFMSALFGTAAACLIVLASGIANWRDAGSVYPIAGAASYLAGAIVVTMVCNVPLNNALAAADATSPGAAAAWAAYARRWTAWNHLRTAACLIAAGLLAKAWAVSQG
jgi:uncharacterized membrane protein